MKNFVKRALITVLLLAVFCLSSAGSHAADRDASVSVPEDVEAAIEQEFRWLQEEAAATFMVTATRRRTELRKVPAIATVITADEIRNMGARDLTDVLKMVPGFGVSLNRVGSHMFEVRGVRTTFSEKIVVMIDGHRLYESFYGSALFHLFNDLSVGNVRQIEVIRGPGSALYGANAFVAVVNIITKDADDPEVAVTGGSFGTKKISVLGGSSSEDLKVFGSFDHVDTDGADVTIETGIYTGAPYSMTPGKADLSVERTEAFLKLAGRGLTLRGHFVKKDMAAFIGYGPALTDENIRKYQNFWTELTYTKSFTDTFSASLRTCFDYFEQEHILEFFPEGFPGYPDGAIGIPSYKNRVVGTELQFDLDMSESNHLIFGFKYDDISQYDMTSIANFHPLTFAPLGSLQDISSWGNYCKDATREVWAAYIQDEWEIRDTLSLTAGVRYDHYDDFGGTVNPRAGLVWNFLKHADFKLLYGQAFRAPNFAELYAENNPVGIGNPDLEPETIQTYEASLGYRFGGSYTVNVNYFHNDMEDQIVYDYLTSPALSKNMGKQKIDGIEVMLGGKYSQANYWQLTYAWQDPRDADTDEDLPDVPSHRASFALNWGITKYLNAHADVLWTGSRPRVRRDARDDMDSYTTVDISLIARNFYKNLEIRGMVHNLFDEEYEDPDMSGAAQNIPGDYPREGVSAMIEIAYRF